MLKLNDDYHLPPLLSTSQHQNYRSKHATHSHKIQRWYLHQISQMYASVIFSPWKMMKKIIRIIEIFRHASMTKCNPLTNRMQTCNTSGKLVCIYTIFTKSTNHRLPMIKTLMEGLSRQHRVINQSANLFLFMMGFFFKPLVTP